MSNLQQAATLAASHTPQLQVNDIHSQLNPTVVDCILRPATVAELQSAVRACKATGKSISICGGRHAMGGQQFGADTVLVDMTALNRVVHFDTVNGLIEVEAGAFWPGLTEEYLQLQQGEAVQWGFAQKQTGADNISIGGTLAANAHGRGLIMQPFSSNVECFTLIDAEGDLVRCSRDSNHELFRHVIGGYGLLGIVASVTIRLVRRQKIQRVVELRTVDGLIEAFEERIEKGYLYGDFQFAIDPASDDFLHAGVFSCYQPVDPDTRMPMNDKTLSDESWRKLLYLAHDDKGRAFRLYCDFYKSTNGQMYWSDTHQMSIYPENYHHEIDEKQLRAHAASEIITEIDVPRSELASFLAEAREDFRLHRVELIYGTVRLIERDTDTALPWARHAYACAIFNLHTDHTPEGIEHSAAAFRRLIDMAIRRNGSYYLTYHRFARREQVLACYPQFVDFLRAKQKYDPDNRFQSDWYRHYRKMFGDSI